MKASEFVSLLEKEHLTFFTGVPCSNLKDFLNFIHSQSHGIEHVAATSEGEAVGIASGYHFATKRVPVIYMQNSGLGNTVNPLTSLMDKDVYSIPAILLVSWRGEPGEKDEPQHKKMGKITLDLLKTLGVPHELINPDIKKTRLIVKKLKSRAVKENKPMALVIRTDSIEKNKDIPGTASALLTREEVIAILLPKIGNNPVVTTTGKTSRELFELREKANMSHANDFLTVGSMGCAASIGVGIALHSKKNIFVIDGDGAVLMKMGTLALIGHYALHNFIHIIIDNGSYESTGGQPTISGKLNWKQLLLSTGYKTVQIVKTRSELSNVRFSRNENPTALVVYTKPGSRKDLGRPTGTPVQNKKEFMRFLRAK